MANGVARLYAYDLMGRVLDKTLPNGGTIVNDYHNDPVPPLITTTTTAIPDPSIVEDQHLDGLRSVIQTVLYAPECGVTADTSYDALGRVSTVCLILIVPPRCQRMAPHPLSMMPVQTVTIKKQDSSIVGYFLCGNKSTVTDETGRATFLLTDALGRLIQKWMKKPLISFLHRPQSGHIRQRERHYLRNRAESAGANGASNTRLSVFSFSGAAKKRKSPDCPLHQSCPIYDSGEVDITVNGVVAGAVYSHTQNATAAGLAQALVNQINAKPGMPVTATLSGTTGIVITSANGANYAFSLTKAMTPGLYIAILQHNAFVRNHDRWPSRPVRDFL